MSRRLVILTEIISPYRIPLFNALATSTELELHVIFLAETDPILRRWNVYKEEIRFSFQVLPSWRKRIGSNHILLNRGMGRALEYVQPDVILCGGYNYAAAWQALFWARKNRVPFLLWSESHARDMRGNRPYIEFLKKGFLRLCSGFVVPGKAANDYLRGFGIEQARIFTAVNAVDNSFFSHAAKSARENEIQVRAEVGLPERYFLFTGRLVREKGIFELLSAYAKLADVLRRKIGVVFVGDGPCRNEIEHEAASISTGLVRFVGFAQREQLPNYYALAEVLILPTYTDPWGLVINEGMACGLPIIVSDVAGCAVDLVTEDWNGKIVPARDAAALAAAMRVMAEDPERRALMALNSSRRISSYSPQLWSGGILEMMQRVRTPRG